VEQEIQMPFYNPQHHHLDTTHHYHRQQQLSIQLIQKGQAKRPVSDTQPAVKASTSPVPTMSIQLVRFCL
jgi:hypothetical protein